MDVPPWLGPVFATVAGTTLTVNGPPEEADPEAPPRRSPARATGDPQRRYVLRLWNRTFMMWLLLRSMTAIADKPGVETNSLSLHQSLVSLPPQQACIPFGGVTQLHNQSPRNYVVW